MGIQWSLAAAVITMLETGSWLSIVREWERCEDDQRQVAIVSILAIPNTYNIQTASVETMLLKVNITKSKQQLLRPCQQVWISRGSGSNYSDHAKVNQQLLWPCKQMWISRGSGSNYSDHASRCEYYEGQVATIVTMQADVNITRVR